MVKIGSNSKGSNCEVSSGGTSINNARRQWLINSFIVFNTSAYRFIKKRKRLEFIVGVFFYNVDICYKGLANVHVSEDFNQFIQKKLVDSRNKYEYSKFDKYFMLFYYKKLNKIAISII